MPYVFDTILVGLIRSFTEFLAIGSSGHMILLREVFRMELAPGTDVAVRSGMIVSVLAAFRADWLTMARSIAGVALHPPTLLIALRQDQPLREVAFLVVGTVPAAILGLVYGDQLASWGTDLKLVSTFVILGGLLLFLTRLFRHRHPKPLSMARALVVGIGQALAIIPGLPRMAAAMSFGVYAGLEPRAAARFAVLLALPALFGILVVEVREPSFRISSTEDVVTLIGVFVASAAAGWLGIRALLGAMRTGAIRYVALYCLLIGLLGIIFL